ncbi:cytochrome P450 2 Le.CYP2 [Rhodocollybia butyracea]|uniref:Cytochrome P450 2 Le.CYP2 n=1 Tax=Rhodocollybia butyracea TaxID=206335 RepID=A0A9P5QAT3_9AGAR|nr:cytochrome P450 2 Le.CYP2 [Rhodocollybia butyracea]
MAPASSSLWVLSGTVVFASWLLYLLRRRQSFVGSYPPGPKSPSMPTLDAWIKYQEWGRKYGDLVYIRENNMLILNNTQVAVDLLDNRARIYSDRPTTNMMKACGADGILSIQRYSNKWRRNRKLFQQIFRQSTSNRFYAAQYMKIHQFLRSLTAVPEEFMQHTTSLSQGLMYAALYGLDISPKDPLAQKAVETINLLGRVLVEPFPAVELFPWLRFMPSWFPGCGFQKIANNCVQAIKEADSIPFDKALNNWKTGTGTSLIAELVLESEGANIEDIKSMGTTSFLAASDTTLSSIGSFLLTMTQYPDVQSKGRAEIDRVVGRDRLPTFEDRQSLPYVESIYREIMRMHPLFPLDSFMFQPKMTFTEVTTFLKVFETFAPLCIDKLIYFRSGCVVVPNIWAMNRDPNVYPDPDKFMPERFLDSSIGPFTSINDVHAYGFGRRVCVGRYMADNTVWLAIASVLATLDLRKAKDDEGNEIDILGEYTKTFLRHPEPFQSSITPRDVQARELILATATM